MMLSQREELLELVQYQDRGDRFQGVLFEKTTPWTPAKAFVYMIDTAEIFP